ncbi:hypothetical protein KAJ27_07665 [bacterium]|nr:hypothetical protein [bacterium]
MSELTKGENAFFQNNYRQAADIFSSILEKSKDPIIRNIALYDLACTKLISSKCDDDIIQGMKMLEKWRLSKKSDKHIENPLILVLAFQKILNFEEQERLKKMKTDKKNDIFLKQQQKK